MKIKESSFKNFYKSTNEISNLQINSEINREIKMKYKLSQYAKIHGVCKRTVWNWYKSGRLKYEKDSTNHIWIIEEDKPIGKTAAVYARVSSSENKSNLDSQAERVLNWATLNGYSVKQVVKEIGSGLNDSRPKLESLLKDKTIDYIIVEHKDRLARFGVNYIQELLRLDKRDIVVINEVEEGKEELVQDFVSIITSFCARIYGQRRSKRKTEQLIKELESNKS